MVIFASNFNIIIKMKKVIVAIFALLVTVLTVDGQVFVGGGLGLNFSDGQSSSGNTESSGSGFGFSISPQIGYYLNDGLSVGVSGYFSNSWSKNTITYPDDPTNDREYKYSSDRWGASIFGRYKLLGLGIENLSLLVEGSIGVQGGKQKQTENKITTE